MKHKTKKQLAKMSLGQLFAEVEKVIDNQLENPSPPLKTIQKIKQQLGLTEDQ